MRWPIVQCIFLRRVSGLILRLFKVEPVKGYLLLSTCTVVVCIECGQTMPKNNDTVSFISTPGFCSDCGSILPLLDNRGNVICYACKREWGPEGIFQYFNWVVILVYQMFLKVRSSWVYQNLWELSRLLRIRENALESLVFAKILKFSRTCLHSMFAGSLIPVVFMLRIVFSFWRHGDVLHDSF